MDVEKDKLHTSSGRLEGLGDGIFSVAMTILVIELKLPSVKGNSLNHCYMLYMKQGWN